MSGESFKIGDTVMLKSGGPVMTIDVIGDHGEVSVSFWDGNQIKFLNLQAGALKVTRQADSPLSADSLTRLRGASRTKIDGEVKTKS